MKTKEKNAIFKARLTFNEDGVKIISFANQKIPYPILDALNESVHDVIDEVNGKNSWRKLYIHFKENGKEYYQVDDENKNLPCVGCCFLDNPKSGCNHPHYFDGTKGKCTGKIYKEKI